MRKRRLKFYANIKIKELFRLRLLKHFKHCEKIYVKPKMRSEMKLTSALNEDLAATGSKQRDNTDKTTFKALDFDLKVSH